MNESLTRFEAQRRLIEIGMPANVAVDYLDVPSFNAKSMLSLAYPGAWPILEAYRRHCADKAAGESSTPVLDPMPAEDIVSSERNQVASRPLVTNPKIVGWAGVPIRGYLLSDDRESTNDTEKGADPVGRASDKVAGIREGWHRNTECCEWHRTGGKTQSPCNTIAHRGTIAAAGIVGLTRDPVTKAIAERLARDTETEIDPATGDKRPIGLSTNVDALRSVIADKAAQVTDDIIGQALTVASGAQAVESLRVSVPPHSHHRRSERDYRRCAGADWPRTDTDRAFGAV
jgi:hypothetical protein